MAAGRISGWLGEDGPSSVDVPLLRPGRHIDPRRGACLLELVSILDSAVWSDGPGCVDPTLARVGRAVNDLSGDGRHLLVPFAFWLRGTATGDPQVGQAVAVESLLAARPLSAGSAQRRLSAGLQRAASPRGKHASVCDRWRVARAVRASVGLVAAAYGPGEERDQALRELLLDCLNACRRAQGQVPVDPRLPSDLCPDRIAVQRRWLHEDGCEWLSVACAPASAAERRRFKPDGPPGSKQGEAEANGRGGETCGKADADAADGSSGAPASASASVS